MSLRSLISPICYIVIGDRRKSGCTTNVVVLCIVRTFIRNLMKIGWLIQKLNLETLVSVLRRKVGLRCVNGRRRGGVLSKVWLYLVYNVTLLSRETNCKRYSSGISPSWKWSIPFAPTGLWRVLSACSRIEVSMNLWRELKVIRNSFVHYFFLLCLLHHQTHSRICTWCGI